MASVVAPTLSFIIPVRNDAARLRRCLESILADTVGMAFEIIVADNGSTDESAEVASAAGAQVLDLPNRCVAEVRNAAARAARGEFIAFVDADHELGLGWAQTALRALSDPAVSAVGAQYRAPEQGTWVQRTYDHLRNHQPGSRPVAWLPGGNLVIRRALFDRLRGFDTSLETCEDVDLCQRLTMTGGTLMALDGLRSIHRGDPATLRALFFGELWRGRDNLRVSLRAPLTPQALPSVAVPIVTLLALVAVPIGIATWPFGGLRIIAAGLAALAALITVHASSLVKHAPASARNLRLVAQSVVIAGVYDVARGLALVTRSGHSVRRRA